MVDEKAPIIDCRAENLQLALQRRGAYAVSGFSKPVDFGRYFTDGLIDGVRMRMESLGELDVPTGNVVACDPFYVMEDFTCPFERRIAPGRYPVLAALADLDSWGHRVAFAMLRLSTTAPAGWQLATTTFPNQGHVFRSHYGVEAGLGLFADLAAAELFARVQTELAAAQPRGNYYDDVLAKCFERHPNWCDHRPDPTSSLNAIIFSTGLGDGVYASYWGLASGGEPVCLVTDFQLFDREGVILQAAGPRPQT